MSRERRLQAYVAAVAVVAVAAVAVSLPRVDLVPALVYLVVFGVTEATSSRLRQGMTVSLANLVVLVALLDQGWATAVICTLGCVPVDAARRGPQRLLKAVFNASQFAVSALAGGLLFHTLTLTLGVAFPHGLAIAAAIVAGLVYVLANFFLVGGVVAVASGESVDSALGSAFRAVLLQFPYTGISILAAVLLRAGDVGPLLLALLFLPVFVARSGLLAFQRVDDAYDRLVRSFVTAIEVKDLYTRGHSERVAELSVHVAEELGIPYAERRLTGYAALLHDVGKIGVPLCIINKPGPLDDDEFAQIKLHPTTGAEILRDIDFLEPVIDIVRYHHERLDGHGYPHGVGDEQLGELVRIVTAVDAFDAMTSTRSYRRALGVAEAVKELRRCVDQQFDRRMVEALAVVVERLDWQPTIEFASAHELDGAEAPVEPLPESSGDAGRRL